MKRTAATRRRLLHDASIYSRAGNRCKAVPLTTFLALAASAAWWQGARAQEPDPMPIKVDVDVVSVLTSVRDKHGAFIKNLTKDDFQIFEDGKLQIIKYFSRETDLPLTIGLLVDVSASQGNLIEIEKTAASQFFSQVIKKKDQAFLISFGSDSELLQDLTNSVRLLQRGLDELKLNSGF